MGLKINKLIQAICASSKPSLFQEVITYLQSIGGSIGIADPAYLKTESDGTGAAVDGSFIGYAQDLANTRHVAQATTAAKPKLVRVPTKLGAELVVNGGFDTASGWEIIGGATVSGGALNIVTTGAWAGANQLGKLQVGRRCLVEADVVINSGTAGIAIASDSQLVNRTTTGRLSGVLLTENTAVQVKRGLSGAAVNGTIDNVSVREVLEWGWALQFDGNDDFLTTSTQAIPSNITLMGAVLHTGLSSPSPDAGIISHRGASGFLGAALYRTNANLHQMIAANPASNAWTYQSTPANSVLGTPYVVSSRVSNTQADIRRGGVGSVPQGRAGGLGVGSGAITIGSVLGGRNLNGLLFAWVYAPIAIPDDKLKMIETYLGSLCGVTIQ